MSVFDDRVSLKIEAKDFYQPLADDSVLLQTDDSGFIPHTSNTISGKADPIGIKTEDEVIAYRKFIIDLSGSDFTPSLKKIRTGIRLKNSITLEYADLDEISSEFTGSTIINGLEYIDIEIPRSFKAPDSELIKNFKFYRDLSLDAGTQRFYFLLFPFLVRWEYWEANGLIPATFFNTSNPHNGLNNNWSSFVAPNWSLYHFTELTFTIDGQEHTITKEAAFTDKDYDTNTAQWSTKTIKTFTEAGDELLSGSDRFILGYAKTKVEVQATWIGGGSKSLSDIKILFRLEPLENGGRFVSSRLSSVRASGNESQFYFVDADEVVVTNPSGDIFKGVAFIDNAKLQNFSEFKITARIYDGLLGAGEVFKATFEVIKTEARPPVTIDQEIALKEICAFKMPVFGDAASSDPLKNDFFGAYFGYSQIISSVVLKLYRCGEEVKTLNDNTYGTFYPYGFQNDGLKKYIGYEINWKLILADVDLGEGEYFVRAVQTPIYGSGQTEDSFTFCLSQYSLAKANRTIRIDYFHDGIIGDHKIDTDTKSFKGLHWKNQLRLKRATMLGEETSFEITQNQYTNRKKQNVKMDQKPEYQMLIHQAPYFLLKYIRTEVLTADDIYLTEYNNRSIFKEFLLKNVIFTGNFNPEFKPGQSDKAKTILKFEQKSNNLSKRFC